MSPIDVAVMRSNDTYQCTRCKEIKSLDNFYQKAKGTWQDSRCKQCRAFLHTKEGRQETLAIKEAKASAPPKTTKGCYACKRELELELFSKDASTVSGLCAYCKECAAKKANKRYHKDPRKNKDVHLKHDFNLSIEDFERMKLEHKDACAICERIPPSGGNPLGVDHCHTTGKIRGLLCHLCNLGLGQFGDSPERLDAAAAYLRRSQPTS